MKRIQKYIGAAILGTVIMAVPSCTDVVDDHYHPGEGTSATESLWDLIEKNPKLSRFKQIAEKTSYYRDETHPQENYTFKDMLQGSMLITAWIPENEAFTDEEFQKWLDLAETNGYSVQQQLLGNSIALWRQVATGGGVDTLTMINGKKLVFDMDKFTMQGVSLDEKNVAATNGTLHTMQSKLPFKYNLYEYLKDASNASANSLDSLHNYIVKNDTTYFSESSSIEGNPDINGNPTYVDSVYFTTNSMFFGNKRFPDETNTDQYLTYDEGFGANIIAEDSTFIMLFPTNNAWQNARQKMEKYYNYAAKYADKDKINLGGDPNKIPPREVSNPDSLKEKCLSMDLASPLCFNLHYQPKADGKIGRWTLDEFLAEKGNSAEYFLNTYGDTLRSDDTWNKTSILEGTQIDVSNGVGIIKNEWDFPAKLYKPDLFIEVDYRSFFNLSNATGTAESKSFSNSIAEAWIDSVGRVSENNFYYIYPSSATGNPKFEFKLIGTDGENYESEVMSGKYDIYVVMVPNFYMDSSDSIVLNLSNVNAKIVEGDTIPVRHKLRATISYCDGLANGKDATKKSELIDYAGDKVDTLLLFEDFEFKYSYKNLRQSYPTIELTTDTKAADRNNKGYSNAFCIDRFILRSKD